MLISLLSLVIDEHVVAHSCSLGKKYTHLHTVCTRHSFIIVPASHLDCVGVPVLLCTTANIRVINLLHCGEINKNAEVKSSQGKQNKGGGASERYVKKKADNELTRERKWAKEGR